jgi:hypothetical protein
LDVANRNVAPTRTCSTASFGAARVRPGASPSELVPGSTPSQRQEGRSYQGKTYKFQAKTAFIDTVVDSNPYNYPRKYSTPGASSSPATSSSTGANLRTDARCTCKCSTKLSIGHIYLLTLLQTVVQIPLFDSLMEILRVSAMIFKRDLLGQHCEIRKTG